MKKSFLSKIAGLVLGLSLTVGVFVGSRALDTKCAKADYETIYTLSCNKNTSNNAYAAYYDVTVNGYNWNAPGNQSQGDFWRIGGKKITNTNRYINGKTKFTSQIDKIVFSHNGVTNSNLILNSVTVKVASDSEFSTVVDSVSYSPSVSVATAGTFYLTPSSSKIWKDCYFKIIFNVSNSNNSTNYGFDLIKAEFLQEVELTEATGMTFNPTSLSMGEGANASFVPTLTGGLGNYEKTISWSSNNTAVIPNPVDSEAGETVTVHANAVSAQTIVTLTGTVVAPGSATASIQITVEHTPDSIVANATKYAVPANETLDLSECVTVTGSGALSFTANSDGAFTIVGNILTAGATGSGPITVTGHKGEETCTFIVVVKAVTTVSFDTTTATQITTHTSNSLVFQNTINEKVQTITISKGTASTNTDNYCPYKPSEGTTEARNQTRLYNNSNFVLDCGVGYVFSKVIITAASDAYATATSSCEWPAGTKTVESDAEPYTLTYVPEVRVQQISVNVTATIGWLSVDFYFIENVVPTISIANKPTNNLTVGDSGTLSYQSANATAPTITWSSSNPSVVSINASTGAYEALAVGNTTITVSLSDVDGDASDTFNLVVDSIGKITITRAIEITNALAAGAKTAYKVELEGYITNLNYGDKADDKLNAIVISTGKVGSEGDSIVVFGIYTSSAIRNYAILNGKISFVGVLQNYNGDTPELTGISYVPDSYSDDAELYAKASYESLATACATGPDAVTAAQWSTLADNFNALDTYAKAKLAGATASYEYNDDIANWLDRYTRIVAAGKDDFMGVGGGASSRIDGLTSAQTTNYILVVAAIASFAALAGAFVLLKKKKCN